MAEVLDAARTFFQHLSDVTWTALAIGTGFHVARLLARIPAWRNILRAAYPGVRVPWRAVTGGYFAGVGVNAIAPARGGDLLKLYLVKHRVEGSHYPTLAPTLLVETLFDMAVALCLFAWALTLGVLPSLDALPNLPQVDWSWPLRHPKPAAVIGTVWAVVLALFAWYGIKRARAFRERLKLGFAILGEPRRYFLEVVTWQALSWGFRFASVYYFLEAFGVPATARNAALVLVVQSLSTLLPITPGGVGTAQGLTVYVFARAAPGVPRTALLSFSVGMQFATTVANVVLGFASIFLMLRTLRWRRHVGRDEKAYARRS